MYRALTALCINKRSGEITKESVWIREGEIFDATDCAPEFIEWALENGRIEEAEGQPVNQPIKVSEAALLEDYDGCCG